MQIVDAPRQLQHASTLREHVLPPQVEVIDRRLVRERAQLQRLLAVGGRDLERAVKGRSRPLIVPRLEVARRAQARSKPSFLP